MRFCKFNSETTQTEVDRQGWRFFFDNGYGASVVQHKHSYGGEQGLWEVAVIRGTEGDWDLDYDTPITSDVLGWLSDSDVAVVLHRIEGLVRVARTNYVVTETWNEDFDG